MIHKFKIGQRVRRVQAGYADEKSGSNASSEIVRLMPADQTGEPSYRIRSGFTERAVCEHEIIAEG